MRSNENPQKPQIGPFLLRQNRTKMRKSTNRDQNLISYDGGEEKNQHAKFQAIFPLHPYKNAPKSQI